MLFEAEREFRVCIICLNGNPMGISEGLWLSSYSAAPVPFSRAGKGDGGEQEE